MVELPIRRFSENASSMRYCCSLKSNSKSDDKIIRRLATDNKCTKVCNYKDCKEHLMKYEIRFQKTEDKDAFINAINCCKELVISENIPKIYA